jgi:hypothetical protein
MHSFAEWQLRMAEVSGRSDDDIMLFLAYKPECESQARSAGFQFVGTTWDANGTPAKAFKPKLVKSLAYGCVSCGSSQATLDQGMYCCGKKRVLRA